MKPPSPTPQRGRRPGFSLVEVTVALGIMSFALLSVVGLFPVGLSTLRDAMDQTTESQIVQRIAGSASLSTFGQLPAHFDDQKFYFDEEGQPLSSSDPISDAVYCAATSCQEPSLALGAPGTINTSLVRIDIEISRVVGNVNAPPSRYSIHVATDGR